MSKSQLGMVLGILLVFCGLGMLYGAIGLLPRYHTLTTWFEIACGLSFIALGMTTAIREKRKPAGKD